MLEIREDQSHTQLGDLSSISTDVRVILPWPQTTLTYWLTPLATHFVQKTAIMPATHGLPATHGRSMS